MPFNSDSARKAMFANKFKQKSENYFAEQNRLYKVMRGQRLSRITSEFDKALTRAEKLQEQESRAKTFSDIVELREKSEKVNARVYQLAKELGLKHNAFE
jgi:tRNA A22 N-methylase